MIDTIIFDIGGVLWHSLPTPLSDKWAERCGLNKAEFDEILFSYEAGMVKPNPDIYRKILEMLGATAVNTLFIDDRPDNVQAALDLGMSSFQFTTTADTIAQIQRLLK